MSKRKIFTADFKIMIAKLALSGKPIKEICSEYSLSEISVRNWVKNKSPMNIEGNIINLEEIKRIKIEMKFTIRRI